MVNFKNYLMGIATVAMMGAMASCSDNGEITPPDEPILPTEETIAGKGYMAFSVSMPKTAMGRANDDFNDGTPNEYAVEDIILVLFSGETTDSEDDAKLVAAYNLSDQRQLLANVGTATDQITSATSPEHLIAEVNKSAITGSQPYAFIIINDHQYVEVEEATHDLKTGSTGKLYDPETGTEITGGTSLLGKTFGQFRKMALNETGRNFAAQSFFMCNAPVATTAAANGLAWTAGKIQTLVPFSKDKIFNTREQAKNNPACMVNVERALAKIDVTFAMTENKIKDTTIPVELLKWDLDNTNNVCYVARKLTPSADVNYFGMASDKTASPIYRFTSPNAIDVADWGGSTHNHEPVYRTYWGEDFNYAGDVNTFNVPMTTQAGKGTTVAGTEVTLALTTPRNSGTGYYTTENTFDVEHQTVKNTTRVVVAAKINEGKAFFTLRDNATELYKYEVTGSDDPFTTLGYIQKYIQDALANRVAVQQWAAGNINMTAAGANWANKLFNVEFVDEIEATELGESGANIKADAGHKIAKISINESYPYFATNATTAKTNFESIRATQQAYLYNSYKLHYYPAGIAYYQVLVQHFGQVETPWEAAEGMVNVPTGANSIYGDAASATRNFLGRYGILRNNWYSLSISGVSVIGSSVVPPLTDDPDDTVKNYMTVHVNILPWVKRTQGGIVL